jgi:hypothetical protein
LRSHRFDINHTGTFVGAKPCGGYFLRKGTVCFSLVFTKETGEVSNRFATVAEKRTFIVGVLFTRGSILTPVAVLTSSNVAHGGSMKQLSAIEVWIAMIINKRDDASLGSFILTVATTVSRLTRKILLLFTAL